MKRGAPDQDGAKCVGGALGTAAQPVSARRPVACALERLGEAELGLQSGRAHDGDCRTGHARRMFGGPNVTPGRPRSSILEMMKRSLFLAVGLTVSAIASAASPVGSYVGRVQMTMPKLPANIPADRRAMAEKMISTIRNMKIQLKVNADKTYTVVSPGNPMAGPGAKPQTSKGKWSLSGNTMTMTSADARVPAGQKSQKATLSADGRTLTLVPQAAQGQKVRVVFTKQ